MIKISNEIYIMKIIYWKIMKKKDQDKNKKMKIYFERQKINKLIKELLKLKNKIELFEDKLLKYKKNKKINYLNKMVLL